MFDLAKIRLILRMARDNPSEFYERTAGALDRYRDRWRSKCATYDAIDLKQALALVEKRLPAPMSEIIKEPGLVEIERTVSARAGELRGESPFPSYENADATLARFCYLACRVLKPSVVLETGVASGITSAFILQALSLNGEGALWSVDLPPMAEGAKPYVGAVVTAELRTRWHLQIGTSRRVLPQLLPQLGEVDVFIHDSLHTYKNMRTEFETAWPFLKPGGLLIADDVDLNQALTDFADSQGCSLCYVVREEKKKSQFGIIIKEP